jgi:hypothetical protein
MRDLLKRHSSRRDYRLASVLLTIASIAIPLSTALISTGTPNMDLWGMLAFLLGLPFYVGLVVLTYYRFQRAAVSSAWLVFMVFLFHVGPRWVPAGALDFHPSGLIALLPVVIGWLAPDTNELAPSIAARDIE